MTLEDLYWASRFPLWDADKDIPLKGDEIIDRGRLIVKEFWPKDSTTIAVKLENEKE